MSAPRYPNETPAYRAARELLLEEEKRLRAQVERVASLRRELPPGGAVADDYKFREMPRDGAHAGTVRDVRLSELFAPDKDTLVVYSYMYGPQAAAPCPMCTSILDSLDGAHEHLTQRVNLAVVAKSPIERIRKFTDARGWRRLRLLSSADNTYNHDYRAEGPGGAQLPALNVFAKRDGRIHHMYATELLYAPKEPGQDFRHVDSIWPLWNVLDLTPEGRGTFAPKLSYEVAAR